jgi:hypothetical protein
MSEEGVTPYYADRDTHHEDPMIAFSEYQQSLLDLRRPETDRWVSDPGLPSCREDLAGMIDVALSVAGSRPNASQALANFIVSSARSVLGPIQTRLESFEESIDESSKAIESVVVAAINDAVFSAHGLLPTLGDICVCDTSKVLAALDLAKSQILAASRASTLSAVDSALSLIESDIFASVQASASAVSEAAFAGFSWSRRPFRGQALASTLSSCGR